MIDFCMYDRLRYISVEATHIKSPSWKDRANANRRRIEALRDCENWC